MAASVAHKFVERVDSNEDWHVLVEKTTGSLIVVDAHASWTGPCYALDRVLTSLFYEMGQEYDVKFLQAPSDRVAALADLKGTSRPTFLLFRNGVEVERVEGAIAPKLLHAIRRLAVKKGSAAGRLKADVTSALSYS